jgi:colanic acid/amylovoran biosynthesis glycosyltransferase
MRVAIISGVFPKVSETFVVNHVESLLAQGHTVDIFSDFRPKDGEILANDQQAQAMRARAIYMDVPPLAYGRRFFLTFPRLARCARVVPGFTAAALNPAEYGWRALSLSQVNRLYTLTYIPRHYDVIHAHFGMVGDRFRATSALWGAPLAVSFHGFDYNVWPLTHGKNVYHRLFRIATRVVANSENTRRRIEALGCPPAKIVRITPHWDMWRFPYRPHTRYAGEPFHALTIARLTDIKGVDDGIRAIALARRAHPEIALHYDIVGDGELRGALETLIHSLDLDSVVTLHGAQDSVAVSALLADAHALLAPSRQTSAGFEEGFGIVLLEAQSAGVPVIATRHGAYPEVVAHDVTGFVAPERDPESLARYLCQLIEQPERAMEMGVAARQRVETHFSPAGITHQTEALYQDMIEESQASAKRSASARKGEPSHVA